LLPLLPSLPALPTICLDADWPGIAQSSPETPPPVTVLPENLAYIIYTSGSTGTPKGVACQHRSVLNLASWHQEAFQVTAAERASHLAGQAFDAAVWELWPYLLAGASLHLVHEDIRADPVQLQQWLLAEAITLTFLPTPLAERIVTLPWPKPGVLRLLLTGGDRLTQTPPTTLPFPLVNNYGPTEGTVVTTSCVVASRPGNGAAPPIGRPIANTQVYVLNRQLKPTPVGVPGELYIGGASLARGYLNRPDLTSERFIPNPWSSEPGALLYRTGDQVRYLPNGSLEFLGRLDQQVKLRGYRIELGEIETTLAQHPAVQEAVVLAREDTPGDKRLVAYVVSGQEPPPTSADLRRYLKERLPEYMVPAHYLFLQTLPLTANGKLDRRALPVPEGTTQQEERGYEEPRTPLEDGVAEIWAQILRLEHLGIHENFFELGGHSLLATQVIARIRDVFQVEVPLRAFFENPTIAEMATCIESSGRSLQGMIVPPITPVSRTGALPLSYAQQGLWFFDQWEPNNPLYNIPFTLRLQGRLQRWSLVALERSLNEIVRRHEALRTTFVTVEGHPVQVISPLLTLALPLVNLETLEERERAAEMGRRMQQETACAFDLAKGPLIRATLFQLSAEEHVLLLLLHHIVIDGWSTGILFQELATLYAAYVLEKDSPLPELPLQYVDFAVWQREWLEGRLKAKPATGTQNITPAPMELQLSYWKQRLAGAPPVLELPTDRPRPTYQSVHGAHHLFILPHALLKAVRELSRQANSTLFMTLLTAFQVLLFRYTRQEDIIVGSPIANRTRAEFEGLIGCFFNTLALRSDLSGNPSFYDLLQRVREVALGAYAHQDVPFEKVLKALEALQPERSMSHAPIFQVMFVLQNLPSAQLDLPGLTLSSLAITNPIGRSDLIFVLWEESEGLGGRLEYNTDLFDASTIERMVEHYKQLLQSIVVHPESRIANLPLLTKVEQRQLLVEWNDTQAVYPQGLKGLSLHELIEKQGESTPNAVAVVCEESRLTYHELNLRSNQLARHLRIQGVGPDVLVALLAERGSALLTSILAVWKAGGAYLPLDPQHPASRLRQVLERSGTRLAIATADFAEMLAQAVAEMPQEQRPQILLYENLLQQELQEQAPVPTVQLRPQHLAYVIYTSGSTGIPKGVMIEQRGMLNHLYAKIVDLRLTAADIVAQTASQCFDISVWQMWAALLIGGQVHILPDTVSHNPLLLLNQVEQQGITILETVPSMLQAMLEGIALTEAERPSLAQLRWLIPTGEALPPDLCTRWLQLYPRIPLLNAYGPTECSDDVTHYPIRHPLAETMVYTPIGRPVGNSGSMC